MSYEAISIIASILIIIGYLPEFYSLYKLKEAKIENAYIWIIWTSGSFLALLYGILNEQYYLIATQITVFIMNIITLLSKIYYIYYYKYSSINSTIDTSINSTNDTSINSTIDTMI